MVFPTMGKPPRANPIAQGRVLKPTLSYFPSYVCFLRRPKLYWVETFFPSLFVPPSSLRYLFRKMPSTYSLTHFPFYNALLVGSQWWCFIHLSHGLHFCSRFVIRWGLLMILLKLALDVGWGLVDDFPQGTIVLICSGWIWSPAHQGLTGYSLTHFPFYNALLVGSQWWCFIHLSDGLHFYSRFLIRWGLLMNLHLTPDGAR